MAQRGSMFSDMSYRLGRVTFRTAAAIVFASILSVMLGERWLSILSLPRWLFLFPDDILRGQIWRLATYPWIELDPLNLLFGVWAVVVFMPQVERHWGERRLMIRMAIAIVVPALLTALLAIPVTMLRHAQFQGVWPLIYFLIAAFASEMTGAPIMIFPFPFSVSGDGLLMFEGALLGLFCIFNGPLSQIVSLFSFGLGIAWFRFGYGHGLNRAWLRLRRRSLEARLGRVRRSGSLRIVSPDDDDDDKDGKPGRYLN